MAESQRKKLQRKQTAPVRAREEEEEEEDEEEEEEEEEDEEEQSSNANKDRKAEPIGQIRKPRVTSF